MMPLLWVVFWSALPPLVLLCGPDCCTVHESSSSLQNVSTLLESLQCHNDYKSYVHCMWEEDGNTTLQLWFKTTTNNAQCVRYGAEVQDTREPRTAQCRYDTQTFAMGIKHTVFFLKNETPNLCSSVPHKPLDLSQHLRARPPVNLSTHGGADGGRRLSWSSPYSSSSSSLNQNITYQLSYRTDGQDDWKKANVTNTSVTLEKRSLLPGRRYEAKVRARVSVGPWSDWSPVVTWNTEEDPAQFPRLHCMLDGEKEVTCSWEVSRKVADFITYQLACRHHHTAPSKSCCVKPAVSSDPGGAMLKYSCSLTDADPAYLHVQLLPARTAKSFMAYQHIRPHAPRQVNVRQKDNNWMVEWTEPSEPANVRLYYQVCYYSTRDQGSSILQNISEGSKSLSIPGDSLVPSQHYQVKVRALVVPAGYAGIPSEWSHPVEWKSHQATWSTTTLIYIGISVFAAAVFLTIYCTVPACQRRVVLWVDSVPSPGKSKILSEIKSATSWTLTQSESTAICKVLRMDSVSTCASDVSLLPTKDTEGKCPDQDEYDSPLSSDGKVCSSNTSCLSFSGPYILCQSSEPSCTSVDAESEEKEEEEEEEPPSDDSASPSPVNFALYGGGYVCLPSRSTSRSTQDLVSHSEGPNKMDVQPGLSEPASTHQPAAYTSGSWPQGGAAQDSGYCHLPAGFMGAAK